MVRVCVLYVLSAFVCVNCVVFVRSVCCVCSFVCVVFVFVLVCVYVCVVCAFVCLCVWPVCGVYVWPHARVHTYNKYLTSFF